MIPTFKHGGISGHYDAIALKIEHYLQLHPPTEARVLAREFKQTVNFTREALRILRQRNKIHVKQNGTITTYAYGPDTLTDDLPRKFRPMSPQKGMVEAMSRCKELYPDGFKCHPTGTAYIREGV